MTEQSMPPIGENKQPDIDHDVELQAQQVLDAIAGLGDIKQLNEVLDIDSAGAKYMEGQLGNLKDSLHNKIADLRIAGLVDNKMAAGMMLLLGTDDFSTTSMALRTRQREQAALTRVLLAQRYEIVVPEENRSVIFEQLTPQNVNYNNNSTLLDAALKSIQGAGSKLVTVMSEDEGSVERRERFTPSFDLAHSIFLSETARLLPVMYGLD